MGSSESASHEWIELHNTGGDINLDSWTITDQNNFSIELAGTIPANSYAVLERSSDDSAPGPAFLIYTGALVNSGATLALRREDGTLVDRVSGGDDWQNIGGDNDTKATAQYTSAGWITAEGTPGEPPTNPSQTNTQSDTQTTQTSQSNQSSSGSGRSSRPASNSDSSKPLELPPVGLRLDIEAPDTGYINQPIDFTVDASGIGDTLIASLDYQWNFGDGNTSSKKSPTYSFSYPGTYVVNVYADYQRQESLTRHEITILPVNLSLTKNPDGDIQINNDSPYEVDISGYKLNSRDNFTFPPHTYILPNQTITISRGEIKHHDNLMLAMYDNKGSLLTEVLPRSLLAYADTSETDVNELNRPVSVAPSTANLQISNFSFSNSSSNQPTSPKTETAPEPRVLASTSSPAVPASVSSNPNLNNNWSYLALLLIIMIASAGVLIKPKGN
jgi:hypothetical protein